MSRKLCYGAIELRIEKLELCRGCDPELARLEPPILELPKLRTFRIDLGRERGCFWARPKPKGQEAQRAIDR
jgi:hypothetical protein